MTRGDASPGDLVLNLHASAVLVGEAGVLLRGASGSGKTRLALALVDEAARHGDFARWVADDRALVAPRYGRIVARPHPRVAGLVERRGLGLVPTAFEPACVLRLVVDLVQGWPPRMPDPADARTEIAGVALARIAIATSAPTPDATMLILAALALLNAVPGP